MRAAISRHLAANSRYSATVFMELPNGSSAIPKWNFPSVSFDRDATATCHTPLAGSVFDVQCSTDSPGQPREITQSPPFQPITVSNGCLNFNRVFENSDWRYAMLAIQTLTREVGGNAALRPACPNCGRSMHMTRITHGTAGLPDQLTFRCGECGVWLTEAAGDQSGHAH